MQQKTMEALVEAAESLGLELTAYPDYSGRGMYGKTTCGVVFSKLGDLLMCVGVAAVEAEKGDGAEAFVADLKRVSTDSMGMDKIVY